MFSSGINATALIVNEAKNVKHLYKTYIGKHKVCRFC